MPKTFLESFIQGYSDSLSSYVYERGRQDEAYQMKRKEYEQLETSLMEKLSKDDQAQLEKLINTSRLCDAYEEDWIYQKAYQDCFTLLKWINSV